MDTLCARLLSLVTMIWSGGDPADGPVCGGQPGRLGGHRLLGRGSGFRSGNQGPAAGWSGSLAALGSAREASVCCEELVHDLGADGDDGSQFAAVDDFGGAGGGVPGQAGDLLDADPAVAQQADEGGAQLARCPAVPGPGLGADPLEHFPDVAWVQGGAAAGGEDQPGVLPAVPGREPLGGLAVRPGARPELPLREGRGCGGTARSWSRRARAPICRPDARGPISRICRSPGRA
jgi:hypothetical protein